MARGNRIGVKLNKGVTNLAFELGLTSPTVSRWMSQGMTVDQIRDKAGRQAGRMAVQGRNNRVVSEKTLATQTGYVPARRRGVNAVTGMLPSSATVNVPVEEERGGGGVGDPDVLGKKRRELYHEAELREKIAKADAVEFKNQITQNLYFRKLEVNKYIGDFSIRARDIIARIEDLGDKLATEDDPIVCKRLLREESLRALECLKIIAAGEAEEESGEESESEPGEVA